MTFINYNGKIIKEDDFKIFPSNRAFRYGDGFFETMKQVEGKVVLENLHMARLYSSLDILKFKSSAFPTPSALARQIAELSAENNCSNSAKIRLTVFAGNGGLYDIDDRTPNYLIDASILETKEYSLNEKGLVIDIFQDAVKPCDIFSPVKSNNFLPYVMAALWVKENGLDDCILLNPYSYVADATIANVFIVKDGTIKTPPLSDGPVNGVLRRHLLKCIKDEGISCTEASLTVDEVLQASEVFLTNAVRGIRWVNRVGKSEYTNQLSTYLHSKFVAPLTSST